MWQNIGSESYWKWEQFSRPMYILKKFSQEAFIGIPCTTKEKEWNWYYPLKFAEQQSYLILPQMRYMSAKRLLVKISDTPEPEEEKIKNAVKKLLDF